MRSSLSWLTIAQGAIRSRVTLIAGVIRCWEPLLWCIAFVMAALIVRFRFEIGQNADGLLQTIMSLQHLTIFFWDQNRFANLLPLLASPITDPTANAQLQLAARVTLGLAAPLLFCVPVVQNGDYLRVGRITLLATGLALAFAPHRFIHEWFIEASPYGTSFALAGIALLLFDLARSRMGYSAAALRVAGLLLTITAYMVNASLVLFAVPLFALLATVRVSPLAVEFGVASAVGGVVTAAAANSSEAPQIAIHFGETFIGLTYYLGEFSRKPGFFLGAMLAIFLLSVVIGKALKWPDRDGLLGYGAILMATFTVGFAAISLSSWVIANDLHPRYLVPLYILAASLGALSIENVVCCITRITFRSRAALCLCVAVLGLSGIRSLPRVPSDDGIVDPSIRLTAAAAASELTRLKLDGIAGDYWTVWPAIFLAEQQAHDLGHEPRQIFGASYRGDVRRYALQTHLLTEGNLAFACLDVLEAQCRALVEQVAGLPLTVTQTLQPRKRLVSGHQISALRLVPTVGADPQDQERD